MNDKLDYEIGSGNVFADIGLPNPEAAPKKAEIAIQIATAIKMQRLTHSTVANILGIELASVSALLLGRLTGFSLERLNRYLKKLSQNRDDR
jgi:predicted XRE-type DNA-binding protein